MPDCNICIEKINKTTRKEIICNKCKFTCCKQCFKRYILDDEHYFCCMSCKEDFTRKDLYNLLGFTFINKDYVEASKNILYDIEKKYFIETQPRVNYETNLKKIKELKIECNKEILRIINAYHCKSELIEYNIISINDNMDTIHKLLDPEAKNLDKNKILNRVCKTIDNQSDSNIFNATKFTYKLAKIFKNVSFQLESSTIKNIKHNYNQIKILKSKINDYIRLHNLPIDIQRENDKTNIKFIKCPYDNCHGSIPILKDEETSAGICPIDENHITCLKCHEQITLDSEHKCNEDILKSIKMVNKTSKHCPNCLTMIQRAYGCNQMFCTSCKTLFDWVTLKIDTGGRHNPMYLEWIRENPNNINLVNANATNVVDDNDECDNLILLETLFGIRRILETSVKDKTITINNINGPINYIDNQILRILETIVRQIVHYRYFCSEFHDKITNSYNYTTSIEYRVKFMLNDISKEEYLKIIYRHYKDIKYRTESYELKETFHLVLNDMFMLFIRNNEYDFESIKKIITDTLNFMSYLNTQQTEINKFYGKTCDYNHFMLRINTLF